MLSRLRALLPRVVVTGLLLGRPAAAMAESGSAEVQGIRWSAPPECPGAAALQERVNRLRARPRPSSRAVASVSAEVTRDAGEGPYRLKLDITGPDGGVRERRIEGDTCEQITDAAAVVLALAGNEEGPPTPEAPAARPRGGATTPVPSEMLGDPSAMAILDPPVWEVVGLVGIDGASFPAPAPGFGLSFDRIVGFTRFELRVMAWLPERSLFSAHPLSGGDIALYAGALRLCRALSWRILDLAGCGGIESGVRVAHTVGVHPAGLSAAPWFAPEVGLTIAVRPKPRLTLSLQVDGLAALSSDPFVTRLGVTHFEQFMVVPRVLAGVGVRLP